MLIALIIGTLLIPLLIALLFTIGGKVLIVSLIMLGLLAFLAIAAFFIRGSIDP